MQKLLVLTDLHICAPGKQIVGLDPAARLKDVLHTAILAHPDAAGLILMGDLTHHGRPEEYDVLRHILADLEIPVVLMVGNHDKRDVFFAAFPDAPKTRSGHVQTTWDLGNHRIITLDSLDGPPYPDGHHAGRLCADRIAYLQDALDTKGDRHALICVHHPPFATGIVGMDQIKLADGDRFLNILRNYSDVHLLCGHVHRTISGTSRGVSWSMLKSTCHQGVLDLSTPNPHLSTNASGAFGLVLLTEGTVVVHSEDVDVPGVSIFGGYC